MSAPLVVVGGGLAAGKLVTELRSLGDDREIVLLAAESQPPYERPPLTKGYLRGESNAEATYVQPAEWYAEHGVELLTSTTVHGLDVGAHTVSSSSDTFGYSKLVIATGARARTYPVMPTDQATVHYLRTLEDAAQLRAVLQPRTRVLVVGGGWIGLEVAASARMLEAEVTLVEKSERLLGPMLGPQIGRRLLELHRGRGVDVRLGTSLVSLSKGHAQLSDGSQVQVDLVLVGVGAIPNDSLAQFGGLKVGDGILVDAALTTSHPDVLAIGDVAQHQHPLLHEPVRVEHWQNAVSQGRCAARILAGEPIVFDELPYFFSDQYDSGLEFFGHLGTSGYDAVKTEPGDSGTGFSVFWYREGRLVAAAHVDQWDRSQELRDRVASGR